MERAKILGVICPSVKKFRGGETVGIGVKIKNTGEVSNDFGVKAYIFREDYSASGCGNTGVLSVNSETTVSIYWKAESYEYYRYKYDLLVEVYSNSDCSGYLLDSLSCKEVIDVWPTITFFKGEAPTLKMSCSADRDKTWYYKMVHVTCWAGSWLEQPPPPIRYIKKLYDSGWLCCLNKNQTTYLNYSPVLPISNEQEGDYMVLRGDIGKWVEGDPEDQITSCMDSFLFIYGGER